jgi:hypothetical protein
MAIKNTKQSEIERKIELLKDMHDYIIDMGDEDIYDRWIEEGVPDEPDEEIFEFIASNDDDWCEVCELFGKLAKKD